MNLKLKYGLLASILVSAVLHLPYLLFGAQRELMRIAEIGGYVAIALAMTLTWIAMKAERERRGSISFGTAFLTGVSVTVVASVVFAGTTVLTFLVLGSALPDALYDYNVQAVQSMDLPEETRNHRVREIERMKPLFYSLPFQAAVAFATVFVIGLLQSLLGAAVISRRKPS
jgi:hypothetical protein